MGVKNRAKKGKASSPYSHGTSREERSRACDLISDFDIEGTRCYVVPIEKKGQGDAYEFPEHVDLPEGHVAGRFTVKGKAYLVLCVRRSFDDGETQEKTSPDITEILTKRELQIAMLVSRGRINKQIAHQLDISEYTVSTHIRRIFSKLGVSSRAAMVAHVVSQLGTGS